MIPDSLTDLDGSGSRYTDKSWQKKKLLIDKGHKTGLGAALTKMQSAYNKAKTDLNKIDVRAVGKLRNEDEVRAAKKTAKKTLAGSAIKTLIAELGNVATLADAAAKKLSPVSKAEAVKIATGVKKMKADLVNEKLTDFDAKEQMLKQHYASQRSDFKNSAKLLADMLKKVDANPTVQSVSGTDFSGAFRNFQNKVGNLPEFSDLFEDEFDGLLVTNEDLAKKTPAEAKKIILKHTQDARTYMAKVLKRAKEKGY